MLCCAALPAYPCAGVIPDSTRHDLLQEVSNLVESPTVVLGSFDPAFLALPRWVWMLLGGCALGSAVLRCQGALSAGLQAPVCLPCNCLLPTSHRLPTAMRPTGAAGRCS